jgi:hypothetical protein
MWKEAISACFKALYRHLPGGTGETRSHEDDGLDNIFLFFLYKLHNLLLIYCNFK